MFIYTYLCVCERERQQCELRHYNEDEVTTEMGIGWLCIAMWLLASEPWAPGRAQVFFTTEPSLMLT